MVVVERQKIPDQLYLVVRHFGKPFQRTQWYHGLPHARARKIAIDGRLFELSTHTMREIA